MATKISLIPMATNAVAQQKLCRSCEEMLRQRSAKSERQLRPQTCHWRNCSEKAF